jgi:hypothetical protein
MWIARAAIAVFALLLAGAFAATAWGLHRDPDITLQALEQALQREGVTLAAQPADEPHLRGVQPQRFALSPAKASAAASARSETFAVYVFSSPRERSRAEDELLRTSSFQSAAQAPIVYRRSNVLLLYRPLTVVNQSSTRYGDLLEQALDNAAAGSDR